MPTLNVVAVIIIILLVVVVVGGGGGCGVAADAADAVAFSTLAVMLCCNIFEEAAEFVIPIVQNKARERTASRRPFIQDHAKWSVCVCVCLCACRTLEALSAGDYGVNSVGGYRGRCGKW